MKHPQNILVFRTGQLGDTLVSVPALHVIRKYYTTSRITLLHDVHPNKKFVLASEVLNHSGLIDDFIAYDPNRKPRLAFLQTLFQIRRYHFDLLIYLPQSDRQAKQMKRDHIFFNLCGIKNLLGFSEFTVFTSPQKHKKPLPTMPHEADFLLNILRKSGINTPQSGHGNASLNIGKTEENAVEQWLATLCSDGKRPWIGIGPGSKMKSKIWPEKKFFTVIKKLIQSIDLWPVVFGGPEDFEIGKRLIQEWGRGYVAAGHLGIREGIAALSRCEMFLGNDTGTIHMAAAAGVKCVGIYSARDYPGKWFPYGQRHRIIRKAIDCEGCMLENCDQRPHCVATISEEEVLGECKEIMSKVNHCRPPVFSSDYSC